MHGWGENEQGWHTQGHADLILYNVIAERKAKPRILVMDNLNAVRRGEDAGLYHARSIIARKAVADVPRRSALPLATERPPLRRRVGGSQLIGSTFTEIC